jgi:hypothetical protein
MEEIMKKKYLTLIFMLLFVTTACSCDNVPASEVNKDPDSSVSNPVGLIGEDISVPESVMNAAQGYVQKQFDYWSESTGCYQLIGGEQQMVGEPATYDNWRIEGLSMVYQYENLDSQKLDLYQIDYRLHTTTPDKVQTFIAGGMDLDDEGWLLPTYPNSTYLVFSAEDEEKPVYLFSLTENDCSPGDELFTSDLINTLRNQYCEEIQDAI